MEKPDETETSKDSFTTKKGTRLGRNWVKSDSGIVNVAVQVGKTKCLKRVVGGEKCS